jgi:hypothetical protein
MEYRKVPVVVRAVQLREDNDEEILEFMRVTECPFEMVGDHELVVHTLEGDMRASKNDWGYSRNQGGVLSLQTRYF